MALRTLSLCSGVGGLDLGVRLAVPGARTVAYVERDPFAASVLVARMEDEALDRAPVWDDLATFDGTAWRGCVDLVVAGFPCQEVSVAGERRAQDGERWLWRDVARIVRDVEPELVFLENVPGILSAGVEDPATGLVRRALGDVLGDLAAFGFDAEWGVLGADDVGAPHRRKRWWCLAYRPEHGRLKGGSESVGQQGRWDGSADKRGLLAHPLSQGQRQPQGLEPDEWGWVADGGGEVGDACESRLEDRGRHALARPFPAAWPPSPSGDWSGIPKHLWPATPQPAVRGVADGRASRVDRLRALGNGVVPQCAAAALLALASRAGVRLR